MVQWTPGGWCPLVIQIWKCWTSFIRIPFKTRYVNLNQVSYICLCIFILDVSICFKRHLTSRNSKLMANSKFPTLSVDINDAYLPGPILQFDTIIHPPIIVISNLLISLFAVSLLHKLGENKAGQWLVLQCSECQKTYAKKFLCL